MSGQESIAPPPHNSGAMIQGRADIYTASRIVIKAGTSVVSTPEGYPSLSRIANIVENAARLAKEGKQVMIVTSGTFIAYFSQPCKSC